MQLYLTLYSTEKQYIEIRVVKIYKKMNLNIYRIIHGKHTSIQFSGTK